MRLQFGASRWWEGAQATTRLRASTRLSKGEAVFSKRRYDWVFVAGLAALLSTTAWAGEPYLKLKNQARQVVVTRQSGPPPGILSPALPTNTSLPTYDYAAPQTCPGCHFILGLNHTSRVLGVMWNATTSTWELTGSGWLSAWHSQTDQGSTENTFCAKCHSPMQASASASFNAGAVTADPIPQQRFQAVTCGVCHPPDNLAAVLGTLNPNAWDGGAMAVYLWKGLNNPASYQTLTQGTPGQPQQPGQEDTLCLNCHEQRHSTGDTAFQAMYAAGVRCIDCHMAKYRYIGGGSTGLPQLAERFHDWKVGTNLPYSCGAQGSISNCHSSFTLADAANIIPFIRQQHSAWWTLSPFNGQPQPTSLPPVAAIAAHRVIQVAEYKALWREIAEVDARGG